MFVVLLNVDRYISSLQKLVFTITNISYQMLCQCKKHPTVLSYMKDGHSSTVERLLKDVSSGQPFLVKSQIFNFRAMIFIVKHLRATFLFRATVFDRRDNRFK